MLWLIISVLIIFFDQITKLLVVNNISLGESVEVIDNFFYLTYIENFGAAWGILQNGRYLFIVLTIIVSVILVYFIFKLESKLLKLSLSFILGGGIGNLIDRIFRGSVVDFLDLYFGTYDYPKFNVADIFVVVGTIILAYYLIFMYKESDSKENS